jgi:hypothetical protein
MTLLKRLFGKAETKAISLTDPEANGLFGATPSVTGIYVS